MCGRPAGFKGGLKKSWCLVGCDHVSGLAVRCHDRGPDGFRERTLNSHAVSQRTVCIIRGISLVGSTDHRLLVCLSPSEDELAQVAACWGGYASPLVIMVHTARAILSASATAATFRG